MARKYLYKGDIDTMAAWRQLESWVAAQIGADSVKYNSLADFVSALGLPRQTLCLKCWDGRRPLDNEAP
jgi:amidophosphoribosyltransferase